MNAVELPCITVVRRGFRKYYRIRISWTDGEDSAFFGADYPVRKWDLADAMYDARASLDLVVNLDEADG